MSGTEYLQKLKEDNPLKEVQRLGKLQRWILSHIAGLEAHDCYPTHLTNEYMKANTTESLIATNDLSIVHSPEPQKFKFSNQTMDQSVKPLLERHYLLGRHKHDWNTSELLLEITPKGVDATLAATNLTASQVAIYLGIGSDNQDDYDEPESIKLVKLKWAYKKFAPKLFDLQLKINAQYRLEHDHYDSYGKYLWESLPKGVKLRMLRTCNAIFHDHPDFDEGLHENAARQAYGSKNIFKILGTTKSDISKIKNQFLNAFESLEERLPD